MSNVTKSELLKAQQLLSVSVSANAIPDDDSASSSVKTTLFRIAQTRAINYHYAVLNANGKISQHVMAPFKVVNSNETRNPQYRDKLTWASFNKDSNPNPNNPKEHQNSNFGNFRLLTMNKIPAIGSDNVVSNFLTSLDLMDARLKLALVPNDFEHMRQADIDALHVPYKELIAELQLNKDQDIDSSELTKLNLEAYKIYAEEVLELVKQGLLTLSTIYINPIANTVRAGFNIDETMAALSNPLMNYNHLMNDINLPISRIPTLNSFEGVVEITDASIDALLSDNAQMLGRREMTKNRENVEAGKELYSLSKVGIIKDFNSDTLLLITINDSFNANNRSRVEALEKQLEKGNNLLRIEKGYLVPVARRLNSNDSRSGINFMELRIERYTVHNSASIKKVLNFDGFDAIEDIFADVSSDILIGDDAVGSASFDADKAQENQEDSDENNQLM